MMLKLQHKEAIVVGGGKIAFRKITSLLTSGARVTVISPDLHPSVAELHVEQRIAWVKKGFEPSDLTSTTLIVIAATHSKSVNELVARSALPNQLVNVVDDQALSTFHVPAKLVRGKLTIAVATDGASPALAQRIRDELADVYDESYEGYVNFLSLAREHIQQTVLDKTVNTRLLKELTNASYHRSIKKQTDFLERMKVHGG